MEFGLNYSCVICNYTILAYKSNSVTGAVDDGSFLSTIYGVYIHP